MTTVNNFNDLVSCSAMQRNIAQFYSVIVGSFLWFWNRNVLKAYRHRIVVIALPNLPTYIYYKNSIQARLCNCARDDVFRGHAVEEIWRAINA